jgi:hypothetical protein
MDAPRWLSPLEIVIERWGPRSEWLFPLPYCYSVVHYFLDRAAEGQALTSDRRVFKTWNRLLRRKGPNAKSTTSNPPTLRG